MASLQSACDQVHSQNDTPDTKDTEIVHGMVNLLVHTQRAEIVKTPALYNLHFEDVSFDASDGIKLRGWYIPCENSRKLIIANHPRNFNRHGCPSHEPFRSFGSWTHENNGTEVDYLEDYLILHESGYNVLTYDMRNFGESASANDGLTMGSRHEAHDVLGSLRYARDHLGPLEMTVGLFCRCNGASAAFYAFHAAAELAPDAPALIDRVRCIVALQPISARCVTQRRLEYENAAHLVPAVDRALRERFELGLDDLSPGPWARSVYKPTYLYGVKNDKMTFDKDLEETFQNLGTTRKVFNRKETSNARWDGYREFSLRGNFTRDVLRFFAGNMDHESG